MVNTILSCAFRAGRQWRREMYGLRFLAAMPLTAWQRSHKTVLRLSDLVSTLNLVCEALVRQHHRFPRGEAVERSETDEERRDGTISYAVRKKGTI